MLPFLCCFSSSPGAPRGELCDGAFQVQPGKPKCHFLFLDIWASEKKMLVFLLIYLEWFLFGKVSNRLPACSVPFPMPLSHLFYLWSLVLQVIYLFVFQMHCWHHFSCGFPELVGLCSFFRHSWRSTCWISCLGFRGHMLAWSSQHNEHYMWHFPSRNS